MEHKNSIMRFRDSLLVSIVILYFPNFSITVDWSPLTEKSSSIDNNKNGGIFDDNAILGSGTFLDEFRWLIELGKLSSARRKALEELQNPSPTRYKQHDIAKIFAETFQRCYDAGGNEYLQKIRNSVNQATLRAKNDSPSCLKTHSDWTTVDPYELWDLSCSILPRPDNELPILSTSSRQNSFLESPFREQCCVFNPGSWTYLRLPAIFEPVIQMGIPQNYNSETGSISGMITNSSIIFLNLEQDGYLRPYDVAGILWPTGYMLSLCLGNLVGCPIPELRVLVTQYQKSFISEGTSNADEFHRNNPVLAMELGTGIGASSIALARSLKTLGYPFSSSQNPNGQPWVVATDFAPHSLALTMANANNNEVDVGTVIMDHFDQSSVKEVKKRFFPHNVEHVDTQNRNQPDRDGFSLIFGSSLQGLFQDTDRLDSALWKALYHLLDSNNPNSLVILAHNREDSLKIPSHANFPFQLVRKLSATEGFFGNMKSRAGDVSDFEISVLQHRTTQCKEKIILPSVSTTKN